MKKYLFGVLFLALAFLAPDLAQAANRWAVCATTCTWNNDGITTGIMWSSVGSGGATGAAAPTSADDVIIDGATCVGGTTCTITTFSGTISAQSITWGACTASTTGCIIAANTNNTNFTVGGNVGAPVFTGSGVGTRKWVSGTGTYAITQNNAFNLIFTMATSTNDTGSVFSTATWTVSGTASGNGRSFQTGGFAFGPTTFNANTSGGSVGIVGASTWASLTINGPLWLQIPGSSTQTITGALTLTGSSSSNVAVLASNGVDTTATISLGAASTGTWMALRSVTTSGAAGLTGSNCFNLGFNTLANGGTCTGPSGGGGGPPRFVGG